MAAITKSSKSPAWEGPKNINWEASTRKSTLVQGELADLEAIRQDGTRRRALQRRAHICWDDLRYNIKITSQNPRILILSFIVFAILCGGGLGLVFFLAKDQNEDDKNLALDLASEVGGWFCKCTEMVNLESIMS